MDYLEADDLIFSVVQQHGTDMISTISSTAYPQTYRAMFSFCVKVGALKTAMFDVIESENPYAFNLLLRCQIEHYLKFSYLFARFVADKSDDVGREYYRYCGAIESRDYLNALSMSEALLGNKVINDTKATLGAIYPDLATMSIAELDGHSAKFKYRAILRYLGEVIPGLSEKRDSFLPSIAPLYATLSSFVHGGPTSDTHMVGFGEPESIEKCRKNAATVVLMSASVYLFTSMAVSREYPEHIIVASKIQGVMNQYLQHSKTRDA